MNNSVFGKTMENVRNRVDIRLAMKPNFEKRTIFAENLIAVHIKKTKLESSEQANILRCQHP
jgi:hypothetical protein